MGSASGCLGVLMFPPCEGLPVVLGAVFSCVAARVAGTSSYLP